MALKLATSTGTCRHADVSAAAEKYDSTARELTARVERLQEAVGVEMLSQMKRMDAKLKTVEISLGEVKQQGVATQTSKQTSNSADKPGKLDKANAQRLASAEKAAAESRSTAEDAAEKAKLASEKAKAALAAVAEHAATAERVKEAEARMKDLATDIEKFRADVAEMEVSSATNTADVVAIEGEWASARRHLKDLEQSVWKSMVMIREETGVGTPSSDAGAGTPATPATGHGDDATAGNRVFRIVATGLLSSEPALGALAVLDAEACRTDINGDAKTSIDDILAVLSNWSSNDVWADVNQSGSVEVMDLLQVIQSFGECRSE